MLEIATDPTFTPLHTLPGVQTACTLCINRKVLLNQMGAVSTVVLISPGSPPGTCCTLFPCSYSIATMTQIIFLHAKAPSTEFVLNLAAHALLLHDSQPTWYSRSRPNIQATEVDCTAFTFHENATSTLFVCYCRASFTSAPVASVLVAVKLASQSQIEPNRIHNGPPPHVALVVKARSSLAAGSPLLV